MCFYFFLCKMELFGFCFFFSSRRRHTRWPRDWSSDVCSSDLRSRFAQHRLDLGVLAAEHAGDDVELGADVRGVGLGEDGAQEVHPAGLHAAPSTTAWETTR